MMLTKVNMPLSIKLVYHHNDRSKCIVSGLLVWT